MQGAGFCQPLQRLTKFLTTTITLGEMRQENPDAKERCRDQLAGSRMHIDPNTDPMFVNATRAVDNPDETLKNRQ